MFFFCIAHCFVPYCFISIYLAVHKVDFHRYNNNMLKTNRKDVGRRSPSLISPSARGLNNITTSGIRTADKVQYPIKMCCFTAHHSINLILSPNVSLRSIYEYHIYSHFDICNRAINTNFQNSHTNTKKS